MEFTLFPKLPLELRLKIWNEAALDYSRIIEVHWASGQGYTFHCHTPFLVDVCKEARAELKWLHRAPELSLAKPITNSSDILYFPYPSKCITSYGMALKTFFVKVNRVFPEGIRNIALSVLPPDFSNFRHVILSPDPSMHGSSREPIPSTDLQPKGPEELPEGGARVVARHEDKWLVPKPDLFRSTVIEACRRCPFSPLKTLTLVVNDPIMTSTEPTAAEFSSVSAQATNARAWKTGVAWRFNPLVMTDLKDKEAWDDRIRRYTNSVDGDVVFRNGRFRTVTTTSTQNSCKILVTTVSRKTGDWRVTSGSNRTY